MNCPYKLNLNKIKATISQIEPDSIILKTDLGEIRWPREDLPENLNIGDEVVLKILTPEMEQTSEYDHKRKLLAELIN